METQDWAAINAMVAGMMEKWGSGDEREALRLQNQLARQTLKETTSKRSYDAFIASINQTMNTGTEFSPEQKAQAKIFGVNLDQYSIGKSREDLTPLLSDFMSKAEQEELFKTLGFSDDVDLIPQDRFKATVGSIPVLRKESALDENDPYIDHDNDSNTPEIRQSVWRELQALEASNLSNQINQQRLTHEAKILAQQEIKDKEALMFGKQGEYSIPAYTLASLYLDTQIYDPKQVALAPIYGGPQAQTANILQTFLDTTLESKIPGTDTTIAKFFKDTYDMELTGDEYKMVQQAISKDTEFPLNKGGEPLGKDIYKEYGDILSVIMPDDGTNYEGSTLLTQKEPYDEWLGQLKGELTGQSLGEIYGMSDAQIEKWGYFNKSSDPAELDKITIEVEKYLKNLHGVAK